MEISQEKSGDFLVLRLAGRLDAGWCEPVESALNSAIRDGEHRIHLDMEKVDYISSAGLRILFSVYKNLLAIKGVFAIRNPSTNVRSVLQMVGIASLITTGPDTSKPQAESGRSFSSPRADYEVFDLASGTFELQTVGSEAVLHGFDQEPPLTRFDRSTFALGIGALGTSHAETRERLGEFLSVVGSAAFQPADGSARPDYVVSEGQLVPEGHLAIGLVGHGSFSLLARFNAKKDGRTVGLTEIAATALDLAKTPAAAIVAITETAGLVGASLRKSIAAPASGDRFQFPAIRDWLAFTNERTFRDSTSLIAGVVAREGTTFQPLLRPHGDLSGHFHAAAFPYQPLQKGRIDLDESVKALFAGQALQAVLHLLADPRQLQGAGESEFLRGAVWIAPIHSTTEETTP